MTEFDAQQDMPAGSDTVFAVVSDLGRLTEWLPHAVTVRPTGGVAAETAQPQGIERPEHEAPVHAHVDPLDVDGTGAVRVLPDQMRLEWGADDTGDYTGWLQVVADGADRSTVALHLTIDGEQPGADRPDTMHRWLDDALTRLHTMIAQAA